MQNIDLKIEIGRLLREYYNHFKYSVLDKKVNQLDDKCRHAIEKCFKIVLLYRLFDRLAHRNVQQQVWGYLISEYDVNQADTVGYSILLQETGGYEDEASDPGILSKHEAADILHHIDLFLKKTIMKRIHDEFDRRMRVSMFVFTDNSIPFMEKSNVQCNCGADKMKGEKIKCSKCGFLQHLSCIGLSSDTIQAADYTCPKCWVHEPQVESAATLIVVPSTLLRQWENEVRSSRLEYESTDFFLIFISPSYLRRLKSTQLMPI